MRKKIPELTAIAEMDKKSLVQLWEQIFGSPPVFTGSKEFLQHLIAGEIQGGVPSSLKRKLDKLKPGSKELNLGTIIVKEWHGRKYSVAITDEGFAYNGKIYSSLTKIAKEITSTAWNGPAFFGLRK